jgi:hypothetical protein
MKPEQEAKRRSRGREERLIDEPTFVLTDRWPRKGPPNRTLKWLSFLVAVCIFGLGIGVLVYDDLVNHDVPMVAIPIVLAVPVVAAIVFRNIWG